MPAQNDEHFRSSHTDTFKMLSNFASYESLTEANRKLPRPRNPFNDRGDLSGGLDTLRNTDDWISRFHTALARKEADPLSPGN